MTATFPSSSIDLVPGHRNRTLKNMKMPWMVLNVIHLMMMLMFMNEFSLSVLQWIERERKRENYEEENYEEVLWNSEKRD